MYHRYAGFDGSGEKEKSESAFSGDFMLLSVVDPWNCLYFLVTEVAYERIYDCCF